jgi:hypothetical protein
MASRLSSWWGRADLSDIDVVIRIRGDAGPQERRRLQLHAGADSAAPIDAHAAAAAAAAAPLTGAFLPLVAVQLCWQQPVPGWMRQ